MLALTVGKPVLIHLGYGPTVMTVVHQYRTLFSMLGGSTSLSGAMIRDRMVGKPCQTLCPGCGVGKRDVLDWSARRESDCGG